MPRRLVAAVSLLVVMGCGVPRDEYEAAVARADSLEKELDELNNGADRTLARAKQAFEAEDYQQVIALAQTMNVRHPGTSQATEIDALSGRATRRIAEIRAEEERKQREAEREREKERLALEQRRRAALSGLFSVKDNVENRTWYWDRESSRYVNSSSRVILYMSRSGAGSPNLLFSVRYKADDWLFIESFVFSVDGSNYRIDASGFNDVERDNGSGSIWEWYTVGAGESELAIARAVMNSKSAVLRYNGRQYYRDRTITAAEKAGIRKVLDAYEAMRSGM